MSFRSSDMRELGKNPYRPGVGARPLYLAGRDAPIKRFRSMLRAAPEQAANMRLTGLRGVGKTVLIGEFESVAVEEGWAAASIELRPGHNTESALVRALTSALQRERESLSRLERLRSTISGAAKRAGKLSITWEDFTFSYSLGAEGAHEELGKELFDTVEVALDRGRKGLVFLLDEAQVIRDDKERDGQHPLSLLISTVATLQRTDLPLGIVMCGLPTLAVNLLRARSYTERMFRGEEIGSLDADHAREAFARPLEETPGEVTATSELIEEVVEEVEGYPYFIQLWGAELWDAAESHGLADLTTPLLRVTRNDIYRRLDLDFYEPRVATLTPAEQDLLFTTARCPYPPLVVSELNEISEKTSGNVNVLLGRLVESGVLYRVRKGQYAYTAPTFRDYLRRR